MVTVVLSLPVESEWLSTYAFERLDCIPRVGPLGTFSFTDPVDRLPLHLTLSCFLLRLVPGFASEQSVGLTLPFDTDRC